MNKILISILYIIAAISWSTLDIVAMERGHINYDTLLFCASLIYFVSHKWWKVGKLASPQVVVNGLYCSIALGIWVLLSFGVIILMIESFYGPAGDMLINSEKAAKISPILLVVKVPLYEEMLYRGLMIGVATRTFKIDLRLAGFTSILLFSQAHTEGAQSLLDSFFIFLMYVSPSAFLTYLFIRYGLFFSILTHCIWNAFVKFNSTETAYIIMAIMFVSIIVELWRWISRIRKKSKVENLGIETQPAI